MNNNIFLMMGAQGQQDASSTIIMLVLMLLVFYFFMIRPQMKKQKEVKKFRESLKKGDKVVTAGGIHGKINSIQDSTIVISVEDGSLLKVEKSAILRDFQAQNTRQ